MYFITTLHIEILMLINVLHYEKSFSFIFENYYHLSKKLNVIKFEFFIKYRNIILEQKILLLQVYGIYYHIRVEKSDILQTNGFCYIIVWCEIMII